MTTLPASDDTPLHLKTRDRYISTEPAALRLSPLKRITDGRSHLLIQFSEPPQAEQVQALEERGVKVLQAASESAVLVSAGDDVSLDGVGATWIGRLEPSDKISPLIAGEGDFVVEFHPDVNMDDARALATEHNLTLGSHPNLLPQHLLVHGTLDELSRLSEWDEVAYILPASQDLVDGTPVMACLGGRTAMGTVGSYIAKVGEGWDGSGLGAAALGYYFLNYTTKLTSGVVQSEVVSALNVWSNYVQVTFSPASSSTATRSITILFASGDHGDGYAFDGSGGTLAHTFYPAPPNAETIAGDMHFDAAESWHTGSDIDLFSVALHEAGHALGLAHSDNASAVMYPYYRKVTGLAQEDIDSIRTLYATQSTTPTTALSIAITSPSGSPVSTSATSLGISGTVAGGTGSSTVTWVNDRGYSGTATGSSSWTIASATLVSGNNVITVKATDTASATASVSVFVICTATTVTPISVAIASPAAGGGTYSTSTSTVTLSGTAAYSGGVSKVTWSNSRGSSGTASGTTTWTAGPITLSSGSNVITVTAYASGGTSASQSLTVTYTVSTVKDTVAPTLRIVVPGTSTVSTTASTITVRGTASDNVGVSAVTWNTSTGKSGTATGTTTWTASSIPLLVGTTAITIRATDAAGNATWRALIVTRR